ncbi:hypothetical protein Pan14r_16470 [Crateriforma conspicua]|uniref:Uncharacterized protein n=1 Tax=Crateriforma conspicua TaxID=2527996 RepID=A0A5C5Y3V5_9PLAN|nr:hypothetical protein Pan14r_16470 [Crateriforma conspicua]
MCVARARGIYEEQAKKRQGQRADLMKDDIPENLPECKKGDARDHRSRRSLPPHDLLYIVQEVCPSPRPSIPAVVSTASSIDKTSFDAFVTTTDHPHRSFPPKFRLRDRGGHHARRREAKKEEPCIIYKVPLRRLPPPAHPVTLLCVVFTPVTSTCHRSSPLSWTRHDHRTHRSLPPDSHVWGSKSGSRSPRPPDPSVTSTPAAIDAAIPGGLTAVCERWADAVLRRKSSDRKTPLRLPRNPAKHGIFVRNL